MPKQLPSQLSGLLNNLCETGRLFNEEYESKKPRTQAIAVELVEISNNLKVVQNNLNKARLHGEVVGGLGLTVGLAAAFLPAPGKLALCLAGGMAAVCGLIWALTANATKAMTEIMSIIKIEDLGKEFMQIIELQKGLLVDIKTVSEELEEKSRNQAKIGLMKTEELQQLLKQTATLSEKSKEVVDGTLNTLRQVKELLDFIITLTSNTLTAEEDAKLRDFITDAALLCENTVLEFAEMRNVLRDYRQSRDVQLHR
ncbi:adenylate kinase [Dissostichus eleginoides]|uniref:Adenylate kinase n=1 Tax=Dissostichus eleginoides TaxID=100907 RepID=A0AAD9ETZ8_DISEL|nr:adenylate kinase [Dissostichus eleginoides]